MGERQPPGMGNTGHLGLGDSLGPSMTLHCHIVYLVHALEQGARPQLTPGLCILLGSDLNPSSPGRITGALSGRLSCPTVWAMEP